MKQNDQAGPVRNQQTSPGEGESRNKSDKQRERERRERIKAQWEEHERELPSSQPRHDKLPLPD